MRKLILSFFFLILWSVSSFAATCTWSGGTGAWNNSNTASWSCGHVPISTDDVVFDGTSGGGTVTVDSPNGAGVVTIKTLTAGAFTGTLDFSANNNNVTVSGGNLSFTGTGVRTINCGSGTFTISNTQGSFLNSTVTNETLNCGSATFDLSRTSQSANSQFDLGTKSYGTVTIAITGGGAQSGAMTIGAGGGTIGNLTISGYKAVRFTNAVTTTITNAFNLNSAASGFSNMLLITSASNGIAATISTASGSPTISWATLYDLTFSGGATFSATNSVSINNVSGISVTNPSGGSTGHIIGG